MLAYSLGENFETLMLGANGVFVCVYIASMLAAWRLVDPKYRITIIFSLLVCAGFALS